MGTCQLHSILAPLALVLAATSASSEIWIVDDDGGPGVDFTDIQPAIDIASDGNQRA